MNLFKLLLLPGSDDFGNLDKIHYLRALSVVAIATRILLDELEKLEYRDDITGSGEYKKYLALEEAGRLMKEVNA